MRLARYIGYFLKLKAALGFRAAFIFSLSHLWFTFLPPGDDRLARIPIGPYVFYFPSLPYFEGLFTEIFLTGTYYLQPTANPIRVIDCGANIGVSLLYIKLQAPRARVLCFEPNPSARAVLEKNINANGWQGEIKVLPYALGRDKGISKFFMDTSVASGSGGSLIASENHGGKEYASYSVEVTTLSQYVEDTVDFLKMDIEGSEFEVLEELTVSQKLAKVRTLQLEYHYIPDVCMRPLSEMLSLLEAQGFTTFVQSLVKMPQAINRHGPYECMVFAWR